MVVAGAACADRAMTAAKCAAPPSARSSRSTEVTTTWRQAQLRRRVGDARRLVGVERAGQARGDVAECAGAGADPAHDHEGGVLLLPAFADVRAARLLADGGELMLAHERMGRRIARRSRRLGADPGGLARDRIIRPMRLFGMAGARVGFEEVQDAGHGTLFSMRPRNLVEG